MSDLYKYRIWCDTDSKYEYGWYAADPGVCPLNNTHDIDTDQTAIVETKKDNTVSLGKKDLSGADFISTDKPFGETNRSFVSVDFCDKTTWWYDSTDVTLETLGTSDQLTYQADHVPFINLDHITDRADITGKTVIVKKNDVTQTSGFTINYEDGRIVFGSALAVEDVVTCSYSYPNSSLFILTAAAGKKLKVSYVESQFSAGTALTDTCVFEVILNSPATGNTDVVLSKAEYRRPHDFLNKSNQGVVLEPFGGLTQKVNVIPWNYLSGFTLKPAGDATTDPTKGEFNKLKIYLKNDIPYTSCEIATATFYAYCENL